MAFATVADVARRLDEDPDERLTTLIEDALEDASDLARDYGNAGWTDENVPAPVKRVVVAAVARYARNPDGFNTSRAADETVGWSDEVARDSIYFTEDEIARVKRFGAVHVPSLGSFGVSAWDHRRTTETIYAPWGTDGEKPFPILHINDNLGIYRTR